MTELRRNSNGVKLDSFMHECSTCYGCVRRNIDIATRDKEFPTPPEEGKYFYICTNKCIHVDDIHAKHICKAYVNIKRYRLSCEYGEKKVLMDLAVTAHNDKEAVDNADILLDKDRRIKPIALWSGRRMVKAYRYLDDTLV